MKSVPEKCIRCGAPINWDKVSFEFNCDFCGKTYSINQDLIPKNNKLNITSQKTEKIKENLISINKKSSDIIERFIFSLTDYRPIEYAIFRSNSIKLRLLLIAIFSLSALATPQHWLSYLVIYSISYIIINLSILKRSSKNQNIKDVKRSRKLKFIDKTILDHLIDIFMKIVYIFSILMAASFLIQKDGSLIFPNDDLGYHLCMFLFFSLIGFLGIRFSLNRNYDETILSKWIPRLGFIVIYGGSIYGSYKGIEEANMGRERRYINRVQRKYNSKLFLNFPEIKYISNKP